MNAFPGISRLVNHSSHHCLQHFHLLLISFYLSMLITSKWSMSYGTLPNRQCNLCVFVYYFFVALSAFGSKAGRCLSFFSLSSCARCSGNTQEILLGTCLQPGIMPFRHVGTRVLNSFLHICYCLCCEEKHIATLMFVCLCGKGWVFVYFCAVHKSHLSIPGCLKRGTRSEAG